MKVKLTVILAFSVFLFSQNVFAQQDSTLLKFVRALQHTVDARANEAGVRTDGKPPYVLMDTLLTHIDSLYKYHINDFDSITIQLDWPEALYGRASQFGVIILHPKRKETD